MTKNVRKVIDAAIAGGHYEIAVRYINMQRRMSTRAKDIAELESMLARVAGK